MLKNWLIDNLSVKNNTKLLARGKNSESTQKSCRKKFSRESSNISAVRGRKHVNRVKWQGRESYIKQWQKNGMVYYLQYTKTLTITLLSWSLDMIYLLSILKVVIKCWTPFSIPIRRHNRTNYKLEDLGLNFGKIMKKLLVSKNKLNIYKNVCNIWCVPKIHQIWCTE